MPPLPSTTRRPPPRRPVGAAVRAGEAWCALALVRAASTFGGFARLQQLLAGAAARGPATPGRPRAVLAETRVAFARARRVHPLPAACLQRSAAFVYVLRRRGVDAQLVVGVRTPPFEAHAWAEVDGEVVNDEPGVTGAYTVITRV